MNMINIETNIWLWPLFTIIVFLLFGKLQKLTNKIWLNPMLLTVLTLIAILVSTKTDFNYYYQSSQYLSMLLEPVIVALGFPLYQQLHAIRNAWKPIFLGLTVSAESVVAISFLITKWMIAIDSVSVSIALKSITTPVGLELTERLNGNSAVTAFAIILAGLIGVIWGRSWLNMINVTSPRAQGLAIGAASHALGTSSISQVSYQHAAYGSLSLIVSAVVTAILAPWTIETLRLFY